MVRKLHWRDVIAGTPNAALHAALFAVERAGGYEISPHTHDFYEMLLIVAGTGTHLVNGDTTTITQGALILLRPSDCHSIVVRPGAKLHWINIAFPAEAWQDFRQATHLGGEWEGEAQPRAVYLEPERLEAARACFDATLRHAHLGGHTATHRELCRFLIMALDFFEPAETSAPPTAALPPNAPPWLVAACRAFTSDTAALRDGLPALRVQAGVSEAHLARVLKAATGQTPTQYINTLRLARASVLLTTTPHPIIDIALECGFVQLSYFYRLFTAKFGQSPSVYRRNARRSVGG